MLFMKSMNPSFYLMPTMSANGMPCNPKLWTLKNFWEVLAGLPEQHAGELVSPLECLCSAAGHQIIHPAVSRSKASRRSSRARLEFLEPFCALIHGWTFASNGQSFIDFGGEIFHLYHLQTGLGQIWHDEIRCNFAAILVRLIANLGQNPPTMSMKYQDAGKPF